MATHLNSNVPPGTNLEVDPNQQPQDQEQQHQHQQQQQQQPQQPQAQHTMQTLQLDQQQAIPIHISHHDPSQEPKYIELNPSTLEEHLPPQYASPPATTTLQTVTYREFKFP